MRKREAYRNLTPIFPQEQWFRFLNSVFIVNLQEVTSLNNENQLYFFERAIINVIIQNGVGRLSLLKRLAVSESLWLSRFSCCLFLPQKVLSQSYHPFSPSLKCSLFPLTTNSNFVFLFSWRTLLLILVWHQTLSCFVSSFSIHTSLRIIKESVNCFKEMQSYNLLLVFSSSSLFLLSTACSNCSHHNNFPSSIILLSLLSLHFYCQISQKNISHSLGFIQSFFSLSFNSVQYIFMHNKCFII